MWEVLFVGRGSFFLLFFFWGGGPSFLFSFFFGGAPFFFWGGGQFWLLRLDVEVNLFVLLVWGGPIVVVKVRCGSPFYFFFLWGGGPILLLRFDVEAFFLEWGGVQFWPILLLRFGVEVFLLGGGSNFGCWLFWQRKKGKPTNKPKAGCGSYFSSFLCSWGVLVSFFFLGGGGPSLLLRLDVKVRRRTAAFVRKMVCEHASARVRSWKPSGYRRFTEKYAPQQLVDTHTHQKNKNMGFRAPHVCLLHACGVFTHLCFSSIFRYV